MRDIAEVRGGFDTYDFRRNATPPSDPDCCLSLIGSERTISLELPGKVRRLSHIIFYTSLRKHLFYVMFMLS